LESKNYNLKLNHLNYPKKNKYLIFFFSAKVFLCLFDRKRLRSDLIFRPIRKYLYSIIFSGLNLKRLYQANTSIDTISCRDLIKVEEFVYNPDTELVETIQIVVCPLNKKSTLEDLWTRNVSTRMRYFLNSISNQDKIDTLRRRSSAMSICLFRVAPSGTSFKSIQEHKLLCLKDIDAFLLTFVFIKLQDSSKINHKFEVTWCFYYSSVFHVKNL